MYDINDKGMWVNKKIIIGSQDLLTIIDGNNDFNQTWGRLFVEGIEGEASVEEIIKRINYLFNAPFGYKALTDEAHCDGHAEFKRFGEHCAIGSKGQKYHPSLLDVFLGVDERLMKGMTPHLISHSISTSPQFDSHIGNIIRRGIKRAFLCGWAFTHCVGDAACAYADQWVEEVYIVRDATRSVLVPGLPPLEIPQLMTDKLHLHGVKFVLAENLVVA